MKARLIVAILVVAGSAFAAQSLPAGTQIDFMIQKPLTSADARTDARFEGTTVRDVVVKGSVEVPAGAIVRGFVGSVRAAKSSGAAQLTLAFDEVRSGDRTIRLRATVVAVLDPRRRDTALSTLGPVAGAGPDSLPALSGVFVGPGGSIAANDGENVRLPAGIIVRIRVD